MSKNVIPSTPEAKSAAEQRKVLAIIFCLFLALLYKQTVWDAYFNPQPVVTNPASQVAQNLAPVKKAAEEESFDETPPSESAPVAAKPQEEIALPAPGVVPTGYPTDGQIKAAGVIVVSTKFVQAELTLLGGRLLHYQLNDYKKDLDHLHEKLDLVEHVEKAPLPLGVYSGSVNDAWVKYAVVSGAPGNMLNLTENEKANIVLEGQLPDGRKIRKVVEFQGGDYRLGINVKLSAPAADSSRVSLEWTELVPKDSPRLLDAYQSMNYVWFDDQKALREDITKIPGDSVEIPNVRWVSLTDKYFTASLINAAGEMTPARVLKTGQLYRVRLSGGETLIQTSVFAGPLNLDLLEKLGFEMKRSINFGRTAVIAAPLASLLRFFYNLLGNYGLAIVVLTIMVKFCLYPLTASSYKQMKAMQDLAPELQKIKESITDKQQQQLAMMELYKKRNVNPLGGCLPMLLQMPVFFGLFSALQLSVELRHAPFAFWIHDLSAPEKLMIGGIAIPVMVILFVVSMLVQQWTTPTTMDPAQKRMMLLMPLIFGFMFAGMPAGLTLYWLTNNTISICQQVGLRKGGAKHALALTTGSSALVFLICYFFVKIS